MVADGSKLTQYPPCEGQCSEAYQRVTTFSGDVLGVLSRAPSARIVWYVDERSMTSTDPAIFSRGSGGWRASSLRWGWLQGVGKLVTSLECAPLDSFILLTQRMERRGVAGGSLNVGRVRESSADSNDSKGLKN